MSTYDNRLDTVEKNIASMKQDIICKIDDTNSAVTIIKGVVGSVAQDVKVIKSETKTVQSQLKTIDIRLEGMDSRFEGVGGRLITFEQKTEARFNRLEAGLDGMDTKLEQILSLLSPQKE